MFELIVIKLITAAKLRPLLLAPPSGPSGGFYCSSSVLKGCDWFLPSAINRCDWLWCCFGALVLWVSGPPGPGEGVQHLRGLPPAVNHSPAPQPEQQTPDAPADMCSWASCSLLILTLGARVRAGPVTQPRPDVSDQQLFWGADQYDFSVVLQAEALECFWHFAHQGENFYLSFMVSSCC